MIPSSSESKKRVAIIGSGFGGLSAAIRLQSLGYETRIFEMRDLPGGRAYVYKDQGFTFDAGPTVITAPDCLEELFALSGRKMSDYVQMLPVTPFYRLFWEDGHVFDYSNDMQSTRRQIFARSPEDVEGYDKFLKYSKEVFAEGYTNLVAEAFLDWWSMIRVSPQLVKLGAYRSVYSMVAKYIKDEHLREAFSFHSLLVGGNPFSSSSIYTLIHYLERNWGVYFPKGGTGALVQGLVKLYQELGGQIHLNSEIDRIVTKDGQVCGVRVKDQPVWDCDSVVSNADLVHTYQKLLSGETLAAPSAKRFAGMKQSMSLFLIYFGATKKYPNLAHHNVIFGPRYKGLLDEIFKVGTLPKDFSLYLHAPTKSDPNLAPPGCEAYYVLSPVAHLGKLDVDWAVEGPKYADQILKYLEERYMPDLSKHIVTKRLFTPKDFETQLNSFHGAAFSLEPLLTQSAFFRAHNRDDKIKGMYIVGAGTHPGAGLPGVVNSAKATTKLVVEDLGLPSTRPSVAGMTQEVRNLGFVAETEREAKLRWPGGMHPG